MDEGPTYGINDSTGAVERTLVLTLVKQIQNFAYVYITMVSVHLRGFSTWYFPQVWLVFNVDDVHYTFCIKLIFFLKNFT